jgi:hypothetical protein
MKSDFREPSVLVELSAPFVELLLKMHATLGPELASALQASLAGGPDHLSHHELESSKEALNFSSKDYTAEFLGVVLKASTLPGVFANIVDMTAQVAPEALEKLAGLSARKRRFIARTKEEIHPGNRLLPTMQTASGWWISRNISQKDLKRALNALAQAAGLSFGQDVIFPASLRTC